MDDVEALRQKLRQERRALWVAESGFLLGAMGFLFCLWIFVPSLQHDSRDLAYGIGAAIVGAVFAKLLVAVDRLAAFRKWKYGQGHRFGRMLHGKTNRKNP